MKILIVDDNPTNRKVVEAMVKRSGHEAQLAASGLDAIEQIMDEQFDLVFMDVAMPGMNGHDATRAIRAMGGNNSTLPIIALTAQAMPGDEQACLEAGMNAYYAKPVKLAQIQEAIDTWAGSGKPSAVQHQDGRQMIAVLDLSALDELADGVGKELMPDMIDGYMADAPKRVEAIQKALDSQHADDLQSQCHALGSASASYGLNALFKCCREVEQQLRSGDQQLAFENASASIPLAEDSFNALQQQRQRYPTA